MTAIAAFTNESTSQRVGIYGIYMLQYFSVLKYISFAGTYTLTFKLSLNNGWLCPELF